MKIQIASDLHLEWVLRQFPDTAPLTPAPDADLLVLAGDIHAGTQALPLFAQWPVPVCLVMGNHEAYGANFYQVIDATRSRAQELGIHFLEMNELRRSGVRLLGTTLWTDYALMGLPQVAMSYAERALNDHRLIRTGANSEHTFSAKQALERHLASRAWLAAHLNAPFEGKTVVVSHHGAHPDGVAAQYQGDLLNGAFFSDLRALMPKVDLWVHGHTHSTVDIQEGRCRVIANPRGYPLNLRTARAASELVFENPQFKPTWVVEV